MIKKCANEVFIKTKLNYHLLPKTLNVPIEQYLIYLFLL